MSLFISYSELCSLLDGKIVSSPKSRGKISQLIIDSRKIINPESACFFAIDGGQRDGHNYLVEAFHKGVTCFIVNENKTVPTELKNCCVIAVKNTLQALQLLGKKHRDQCSFPVIAITGSNGKTIVKEWLFQLLKSAENIVRSPKSFNSQVGVPLSLWLCQKDHSLGIFEAGISKVGEMEVIENLISPTIGIITNIGKAHDQNFSSREQKTKEKLKLFYHAQTIIYCKEHDTIHQEIDNNPNLSNKNTFCWSKNKTADLQITQLTTNQNTTTIVGLFQNKEIQIQVPFYDKASIENAIHCWATLLFLKQDQNTIEKKMMLLEPIAMRLELKEGLNNCSIINDFYNSDIKSLEIALNFFDQQKQHQNKTVVLSDILESGVSPNELYKEVNQILIQKEATKIIGIGSELLKHQELFSLPGEFYATTSDFLSHLTPSSFNNETILLKGSRIFEFEKISAALQKKVHNTVLEINLSAVQNNLSFFKSKLKPTTKIMVMVKAFSYGSGSFEIASFLQFHKVDYLGVAYVDEGIALREAGISLPIMVMNPDPQAFDTMIEYQLEPELFSFRVLNLFVDALQKSNTVTSNSFPVHLKIDTGMHRLGFNPEDLNQVKTILKNNPNVKVASVFSHLATSDDKTLERYTKEQISIFETAISFFNSFLETPPLYHILNSAGILAYPHSQFNMVRLGLGLYGISAYPEFQEQIEPVSTLKTIITQIKHLKEGDSVGYSRGEIMKKATTIATVPIGYADGLRRSLGNRKGSMYIQGEQVPIIGNVCMDMCMLDISNIKANEGDEVIIFGKNHSVSQLAKNMNTISYEALTGISPRVKRIYYQE